MIVYVIGGVKNLICLVFIISLIFPIHNISIYIIIRRLFVILFMYNISIISLLYLIHMFVKTNRNKCLICYDNPKNFLTVCERCNNIVCTTCYVHISFRSLQHHRCKYICPFCRNKTKKYLDPSSMQYFNSLEKKTVMVDFINYVYTML